MMIKTKKFGTNFNFRKISFRILISEKFKEKFK